MGLFSKLKKGVKKSAHAFGKVAESAAHKVGDAALKKARDYGKAAITSAAGGLVTGEQVDAALFGKPRGPAPVPKPEPTAAARVQAEDAAAANAADPLRKLGFKPWLATLRK